MNDTSESKFFLVVEAESDGTTLKVPTFAMPALDAMTWEQVRIHNEVEAMDWELG